MCDSSERCIHSSRWQRPNHEFLYYDTGATVVEISLERRVQTNPVPESAGLRLAPVSSNPSAEAGLDVGLWAVAEALDPGARLAIA